MATKIEWCDETWSPVTGCTPVSAGCENCYAKRMATRLAGRCGYPADEPFRVTVHPERFEQPLRWRKRKRVFVCSMGDLFHPDVPFDVITDIFDMMCDERVQQHTFLVLTKRPERIREWLWWVGECWPGDTALNVVLETACDLPIRNIYVGTSIEDQGTARERIPTLLNSGWPGPTFVSCEPLLGPVQMSQYLRFPDDQVRGVNWVICGGETGPGARGNGYYEHWARGLMYQCRNKGVPFFHKQMVGRSPIPEDLMVREWPKEMG